MMNELSHVSLNVSYHFVVLLCGVFSIRLLVRSMLSIRKKMVELDILCLRNKLMKNTRNVSPSYHRNPCYE